MRASSRRPLSEISTKRSPKPEPGNLGMDLKPDLQSLIRPFRVTLVFIRASQGTAVLGDEVFDDPPRESHESHAYDHGEPVCQHGAYAAGIAETLPEPGNGGKRGHEGQGFIAGQQRGKERQKEPQGPGAAFHRVAFMWCLLGLAAAGAGMNGPQTKE